MNPREAAVLVVVALAAGCSASGDAAEGGGRPLGPVPTTTTAARAPGAGPGSAGLERTDALERRWALAGVLPHAGPDYRIDYAAPAHGPPVVEVTLLVVLNRAHDLPTHRTRMAAAKSAALRFLAANGAEAETFVLRWLPPEATAL